MQVHQESSVAMAYYCRHQYGIHSSTELYTDTTEQTLFKRVIDALKLVWIIVLGTNALVSVCDILIADVRFGALSLQYLYYLYYEIPADIIHKDPRMLNHNARRVVMNTLRKYKRNFSLCLLAATLPPVIFYVQSSCDTECDSVAQAFDWVKLLIALGAVGIDLDKPRQFTTNHLVETMRENISGLSLDDTDRREQDGTSRAAHIGWVETLCVDSPEMPEVRLEMGDNVTSIPGLPAGSGGAKTVEESSFSETETLLDSTDDCCDLRCPTCVTFKLARVAQSKLSHIIPSFNPERVCLCHRHNPHCNYRLQTQTSSSVLSSMDEFVRRSSSIDKNSEPEKTVYYYVCSNKLCAHSGSHYYECQYCHVISGLCPQVL